GVERDLATRILQPVVENACRYAFGRANVSIVRGAGRVQYVVEDDGPGVAPSEREAIFEPGVRGGAGVDDGAGAGLGLALARRLARSTSGDVEARTKGSGGVIGTLPAGGTG